MRTQRLRPAHHPAMLASLYEPEVDHRRWVDHRVRVGVTVGVAQCFYPVAAVADLACGDGAIVRPIVQQQERVPRVVLGDLVARPILDLVPGQLVGDVLANLERIVPTDLFIATEILEHVDDPKALLLAARGKARRLLLSTPVAAWDDPNPEHYWAWDAEAVGAMLTETGWSIDLYASVGWPDRIAHPYTFGVWAAS